MTSTVQRLPFGRNEIKVCHETRRCLQFITSNANLYYEKQSHLPAGFGAVWRRTPSQLPAMQSRTTLLVIKKWKTKGIQRPLGTSWNEETSKEAQKTKLVNLLGDQLCKAFSNTLEIINTWHQLYRDCLLVAMKWRYVMKHGDVYYLIHLMPTYIMRSKFIYLQGSEQFEDAHHHNCLWCKAGQLC